MAASAIVCATDDDLANLNIALDARRLNPSIRVAFTGETQAPVWSDNEASLPALPRPTGTD